MTHVPVQEGELAGKTILITGAAQRIGRELALASARAGANVIIHFNRSRPEAEKTQKDIYDLGRQAFLLQADLNDLDQVREMIPKAAEWSPIYGLVNNASVFQPLALSETTLESWQENLNIHLTAPFLLSQAFANTVKGSDKGRIVNLLDWRALRPANHHFPYTVSKAALSALTRSMAASLAPHIAVNGLALGAILPPSSGEQVDDSILASVPARRWGDLNEVSQAYLFLMSGPEYITGEIIHVDGGRHLI